MAEFAPTLTDVDAAAARAATPAQKLCAQVRREVSSPIDADNVVLLLTRTMQAAERAVGPVPGPEKKSLVLDTLKLLADELSIKEADRQAVEAVVGRLAGAIIDDLIAVAKGQFFLGADTIYKKTKSCWAACRK